MLSFFSKRNKSIHSKQIGIKPNVTDKTGKTYYSKQKRYNEMVIMKMGL